MDILNIKLSHHLRRKLKGLSGMVIMIICSRKMWPHFHKMANSSSSNLSKLLLGWKNTLDRRLRTDQESTIKTISTYYLEVITSILMAITSTRKDMINLVATMITWPVSIFRAQSTLICQCRNTKAIKPVTIEALTRSTDSQALTMECRKIRSFDATMEVSMLIRTTKASMVSNILISSHKRAGGVKIKTMPMDSTTILSKTSTEGTLKHRWMWCTHRQRIKRWTSAIIMTKCLLVQRIRSSVTVTINRTKSHLGLLRSITRLIQRIDLLKMGHQHQTEKKAMRNKMICCWWQSCEMGVSWEIVKTLDWS